MNTNLPISFSAIRGYGSSFWMDVVEMVAISSLLGSPESTPGNNPVSSEPDCGERIERYTNESRVMFELADTAVSEQVRRESLKLAAEWLKLVSETRKPVL